MKNKKIKGLVTLAFAFLFSVCAGIVINSNVRAQNVLGDPTLVGGEIEEEYILGEYFAVPSAQITCDGTTLNAKAVIRMPSGELVQGETIHLTQGGIYTIEYRAVFDGKVKSIEKTFTVQTPLFYSTTGKSEAYYGVDSSQYQTGISGVTLSLADGDIVEYGDIIDLNESDGSFLEFFVLPSDGAGTNDARKIVVTLTDVYNPEIQLSVIMQCAAGSTSGDTWFFDYTYVQAGGQNQTPAGFEVGTGKIHKGNEFGAPTRFSMYGMHGATSAIGNETLKLTYNAKENVVYANTTPVICMSDLEAFDNPWDGFTTGEVRMSLYGGNYIRPTANLMITKVGVNAINNDFLVDKVVPAINVDFNGYDKDALPTAGEGYAYPVFAATAMDKISGFVPVKTTVYYNYESNQRYQVEIKDGMFKTERTGEYTIEYLATDAYGNVAKELVVIHCEDSSPVIMVEPTGAYAVVGKTGEIFLPADIAYEGGTGEIKTYATIKAEGGKEIVMGDSFRPEEAGDYTVTLYAVDMLGKTETYTYTVEIEGNDNPVFLDDVILPRYFVAGYNYTLPELCAYDYSVGKEQIGTTISVKDGNGEERALGGYEGKFTADADGFATIIYNATGKNGSNKKEYKVRVIDTWLTEEALDMSKYFYGEGITTAATVDGVHVSATADTEYTFVNPVLAHKFELQFAIKQNNFTSIQLIFADSKDASIQFTVEIEKSSDANQSAPYKLNGKQLRACPEANFYNGESFTLVYDNANMLLQDGADLKQEIKNADGSAFAGFPSQKIYVTAKVTGVNGATEVLWEGFGGQILSDLDVDTIEPSIAVTKEYESGYTYKSVCEIYSAISADVLSPETYTGLTVYDPNGDIVTAVDGTLLSNVPFDRSYFVKLEYYGSYSVVYESEDAEENRQTYYYALYVADEVAPVITLKKAIKTEIKLGQSIDVVKATALDNVDGEVPVYVYLVESTGVIITVEMGGSYKPVYRGVYELRYMSFDEFGNLTIERYQITVV